MSKHKFYFYGFAIILLMAFGLQHRHNLSPAAKMYIDEVVDLLEKKSVNRNIIDWENFRNDIYTHAGNAQTIQQTYPSISYAITQLNDHHSYFAPNQPSDDDSDSKPLPILVDEVVPNDIGYIRVGFCMGNEEQTENYMRSITDKIISQDKHEIKGWIVDLRGNFGGNMHPMLTAIGPVLGEGIIGYSSYPDNSFITWNYKDGKTFSEEGIWEEAPIKYQLKNTLPYVAVLTDSITASSGEAVTVAFRGRKKTKSFGGKTFGVSTGNMSYTLSDGSRINLTECVFTDRNKNKYGKSVVPDVLCDEKESLQKAIDWILSQNQ